jgi:hypothetical protein
MVDEHNPVMHVCAGSQLERPALNVHLRKGFSFGAYLLGQDADGHSAGDLVDIEVKHFLIEISIDDKDVMASTFNEGAQVAMKGILFAGLVDALDLLFGEP